MVLDALPALPAPLAGLVRYIDEHPETPMTELLEPYRKYEAKLRQAYAQDPGHELLKDPYVNCLPLFTEDTSRIKIRARRLDQESKEEQSKYIMPLPKEMRRPHGSPAVVQSLKEFQRNFNIFSESSLVELDWNNVVASGSAVANCLLPVPDEYNGSKRGLREFYHEKFCPASDVDLFLYGLSEEQAIEKIKDIERQVRDALLTEITVVRTKHAITICSQHPTRHIQIVLRIYKTLSEILTGFDIDCSGVAYDGKQVYCTARAIQSYMTQINHIDLSRRSPSYESRLSKYSHRGFEVYWPDLDRSRVDPTIFERSFQRTVGLARLLVLERFPTTSAREQYLEKRRRERGRPAVSRSHRQARLLAGNIKGEHEDEIADWVLEEDVSNYHTFTIPYGPKFHAKKIEKLCYTRDLLLNAEWNQPDDREVYLHRHPAFFGRVEDVINDCCGYCPVPETEKEKEVAEAEQKIFVSGKISFLKDDPGRQEIGSFHPLTADDWTEMAYVGDTERLCQAIVDGDVEHVKDWLSQEGVDPDTRDFTGRTPLHLATMCSTPEVVRALVDAGARLVARLADGRTALHIAAARGDVEIVKILLQKSTANEAEFEDKQEQRRRKKRGKSSEDGAAAQNENDSAEHENEEGESDGELVDDVDSDDGVQSMATGSFVKIGNTEAPTPDDTAPGGDEDEPNFYDINVVAWDIPCSALHFAILGGHVDVVKILVQEYGADVLLPVRFFNHEKEPNGALLTLVLALALPVDKANEMVKTLFSLGATSAQADMNGQTAFHQFVRQNARTILDSVFEMDKTGVKTAINHIVFHGNNTWYTPLQVAADQGHLCLVTKMLDNGALPHIDFETWVKSAKQSVKMEEWLGTFEENQSRYKRMTQQPLILALNSPTPEAAIKLLDHGADPNVLPTHSQQMLEAPGIAMLYYSMPPQSALDIALKHLEALRQFKGDLEALSRPQLPEGIDTYLDNFEKGSYQYWIVSTEINKVRWSHRRDMERYEEARRFYLHSASGVKEKKAAIEAKIKTMEEVREALLAKGAKTFTDLYPERQDLLGRIRPREPNHKASNGKMEPFKYSFTFKNVKDTTEARKSAYLKLFDAAWKGDLDTIKKLTLTAWDDAKEEAPLQIAVYGDNKINPFSLAFSRRHYKVAKAILEIAQAQYVPKEKPKTRYRMDLADDDSSYSEGTEVEDEDDPPRVYGEIIDAQFTIDSIGQVSMKVNSQTKPQEMLDWTKPLSSVIQKNDMEGLKFIIDVREHLISQKLDSADEVTDFYAFPDVEFQLAVQLGRVELLGEIIKRTGAGLPLARLVEDTGVEVKAKPRYYQGLTVYGKKKKEWAAAGRKAAGDKSNGVETSPLIIAAKGGSIESVEWFLSDTPLRHYLTFAKSKVAREDARLKHLAQAPGGIEGAISKWLNDQSELVLHAAIVAKPSKSATELVSYLVKTRPSLLDLKAACGATPLMLACRLGRVDFAKILIDAGADQTTKDRRRNNLLHAALHFAPTAKQLRPLLDLLDRETLIPMLKERNSFENGGRTPFHQYFADAMSRILQNAEVLRMFKLLVGISPETAKESLRMLDGTGNTPLHLLLAGNSRPVVVRAVIDFDPGLLLCENAVGRTPAEVAHDRFVSEFIEGRRVDRGHASRPKTVSSLPKRNSSEFVAQKKLCYAARQHEPDTFVAKNWRVCAEALARPGQPKRALVSLLSANVVAQRLGNQPAKGRYGFQVVKKVEDDNGTSDGAESGDDEGGGAAASSMEKKLKRRREDVISSIYHHFNDAWKKPKEKPTEEKPEGVEDNEISPEEAEDPHGSDDGELFPLCSKCGEHHDL